MKRIIENPHIYIPEMEIVNSGLIGAVHKVNSRLIKAVHYYDKCYWVFQWTFGDMQVIDYDRLNRSQFKLLT